MGKKRLLVIGFDSADIRLIRRWAEEGLLPNFRRFLETSLSGEVRNPRGFEAGALWPSFFTGRTVDRHGLIEGGRIYDPQTYSRRMRWPGEEGCPPFWKDLDDAGRRVVVVDVPYVTLDPELRGIQVSDWMTHVRVQPDWLMTTPPELARRIEAAHGRNPFESPAECPTDAERPETPGDVASFRDKLLWRTRAKADFSCELLRDEAWEFFISVFHEVHDIGHMCWHLHDREHEFHDAATREAVGDPVRDSYVESDRALGRMLEAVGADDTVVVYCSHGIGAERTASTVMGRILKTLEKSYTGSLTLAFRREAEKLRARATGGGKGRKEAGRLFFPLHVNNATGGVRFNLRGRDPRGKIAPGAEFAEICGRLKKDLGEIVNAESGEPLIDEIFFTDEHYGNGPKRDRLPDMCLEWNKSAPIRVIRSPKLGTLRIPEDRTRVGDHVFKTGVFFASGGRVTPGALEEPVAAEDFAPTFARFFGCPADRFDGRAIPGLAD